MSDEYRDWQDGAVKVVMNHERICSIWPADRENALGWEDVDFVGSKQECLEFIREHCDGDCRLRPEINTINRANSRVPDGFGS
jgi:MbtH protein